MEQTLNQLTRQTVMNMIRIGHLTQSPTPFVMAMDLIIEVAVDLDLPAVSDDDLVNAVVKAKNFIKEVGYPTGENNFTFAEHIGAVVYMLATND